ncbi:uncharacterized protein LOC141832075 isoform X3 [Curcuma longa]
MFGAKGASLSEATSCISSGDATSSIKESEVDQDVSVVDQGTYYYGHYDPGSHGVMGEWDNSCCFNRGTNNVQVEHPVSTIQADSGSLIYYLPGFQTGYNNYGPFLPGPMYCADGQFWGQGSYYASPVSPQTVVSPGIYAHPIAYGPELIPAYPWDPYFFFQDEIQGNTFTVDPTNPHYKPNHSSHGHNLPPSKTSTTSKVTSLASDLSHPVSAQSQTQKSVKKAPTAVLPKGYVPLNKFSAYANQVNGALLYPNSAAPMKENRRSWVDDEKLKARNKLNSLADLDLLNEQNRGPRTKSIKTTNSGENLQETLSIKQNDNSSGSIDRDEYNSPDFITKYEQALFFVIKSYSEDDVHKSIKYNVWSSTPNGNKRLDNAFQAAQGKMAEKGGKCPVFLFFSVNASGQFCGVAEMTGRVDFSKNMPFWQQDKWNGFFPVKWHIIKDVPNPRLRHIILENNENKPVTNSRDTQEVKFPPGTEMLNIFKSYSAKTSILDDFGFYENRQKAMQEKRSKPTTPTLDNSLSKMVESSQFQKLDDSKSHKLVLAEVKQALPCSRVTSPK